MSDFNRLPAAGPQREAHDDAIDAAMAAAAKSAPAPVAPDVPLKKLWDADLEQELEAALSGFDADNFDYSMPDRVRPADTAAREALAPAGILGQEQRKGPQKGKVIGVRGKSVFVDLGAKSEGVVPIEQFGANIPAPGALIEVNVDRLDEAEGLLLLSLKGAAVEADWETIRKGMIVEARVTKTNKGGLDVEVNGIRGFLPIGQIDINRVEDASIYINQKLRCVVTDANQREKNLVVSRRDLLEEERAEHREITWASLEEGQVRMGVIRSVKEFGAFVDIGGVDGLLHIGDMSWTRLNDATSLVKVGQEVEVKILKIDRQTSKVSLGLKQLMPSPWDDAAENYARGQVVNGKVTRLMEFGAFVELEPGIEGLIHVSELSPNRVRKAADIVQPGQEVEVRILKVEPEAKRISLSLRPLPQSASAAAAAAAATEEAEDDTPPPPKLERKIPLKGGGGGFGGGPIFPGGSS